MAILWKNKMGDTTVFENNRKSLIQHGERSERRLRFERTKVYQKMLKMVKFGECLKTYSVTRATFKRTKIGENAEIQKFKCDILRIFQTL